MTEQVAPSLPAVLPALPALVEGKVVHRRFAPFERSFEHGAYQWLIDLDDPQPLPRWLRHFAAFRAEDHIGDPRLSIKENITGFAAGQGIELDGGRVLMLCNARVFGHTFNPLSVFWCLAADGRVACIVAEVHNTYGERHAYLLEPDDAGRAETDKQLYVSPFFDVSGRYELRFSLAPESVVTTILLRRGEERSFAAAFSGRPRRATTAAVLRASLRRPLMPLRVSALIRMHGIRLWARRLPIVPRPRRATDTHDQEGTR